MTDAAESKDEEGKKTKGGYRETLSTVLWALGIAFVLRTFLFQPFHIPSGSMEPGLVKGDYIITSKYSVGYGKHAATPFPFPVKKGRWFEREPKRGDVIVFRPQGDKKNFIKRLVGLPGDEIQMKDGRLYINRVEVPTMNKGNYVNVFGTQTNAELLVESISSDRAYEILDAVKNYPNFDDTDITTVPPGYYFMMGDNRDNSKDSRFTVREGGAGIVPKENIIGRAEIILLSVDDDFVLFKPWTWLNMRKDRWFKDIK